MYYYVHRISERDAISMQGMGGTSGMRQEQRTCTELCVPNLGEYAENERRRHSMKVKGSKRTFM